MKKNLTILIFTLFGFLSYSQIHWMTLSQALETQKKQPKKILISFYANWCSPCREMERTTYSHLEIVKIINDNFYPVKFESDGNEVVNFAGQSFSNPEYSGKRGKNPAHEFTKYMNINMIPTLVFLDESANPITHVSGFLKAKEIEPYLTMIATNDYKSIKSREEWEDYQKKFKSKIKD